MGPPPQSGPPPTQAGPAQAPWPPAADPRQAGRTPNPAVGAHGSSGAAPEAQGAGPGHTPAAAGQARSFSVTKLTAGGLAAASSAVCGSYFGVLGTVGGAAAGSLVTALSTEIYQRFLEHARDRIRPGSGKQTRSAAGPAQYAPGYDQAQYDQTQHDQAPVARRRWLPRMVVVSVVLFALAMGAVSGIEALRGEPLSGGTKGTSVGHLLGGGGLGSTVDGLLGGGGGDGSDKSGENSGDDQKKDHGLVGGLLGGLTGN
jgi:hypothetical protein